MLTILSTVLLSDNPLKMGFRGEFKKHLNPLKNGKMWDFVPKNGKMWENVG